MRGSLVVLASLAASSGAPVDASIPACSMNGELVGGVCACDAGWSGAACHVLDLAPAAPLSAASQTYFHPGNGGAAGGGFVSVAALLSLHPVNEQTR